MPMAQIFVHRNHMPQYIVYSMIFAVFFVEHWIGEHAGPVSRLLGLSPDLISAFATLVIIALAADRGRIDIQWKYLMLLFFFIVLFVASVLATSQQPGTVIVGIRNYLKYLPLFFLPTVYRFTTKELSDQL